MGHLRLVFSALAVMACVVCQAHMEVTDAGKTISFQPHSVNALDQWPSLWRHGMRHAKLDPHYVEDLDLCREQMGDRHQVSENGCLLLNHDSPEKGGQYNSTDDLLDYLARKEVTPHLSVPESRMMVALCFKDESINPCDGSTKATKWTALVNDFVARANRLVSSTNPPLNLEFIFDGAAKPKGCTIDSWRPWNSTWIKSPWEALLSDDGSKGYDRYRVLNLPENEDLWQAMAVIKYGKFSKNTVYPLQLWEPSDEKEIVEYSDHYIKSGVVHQPGFLFATNTNPTMFELYAGTRTGRVVRKADAFDGWQVVPGSVVVARPADGAPVFPLPILARKMADGGFAMAVMQGGGEIGEMRNVPAPAEWEITSASHLGGGKVLLTASDGATVMCKMDDVPTCTKADKPAASAGKIAASFAVEDDSGAEMDVDVVRCGASDGGVCSDSCSVAVEVRTRSPPAATNVCVSQSGSIQSVSADGRWTKSGGKSRLVVLVALGTSDKKVLGVTLEFGGAGLRAASQPLVLATLLEAGENPHVSATHATDDPFGPVLFLVVAESGYCFNSHHHNTMSNPTVCAAVATPTRGVLTYTYGVYEDFKSHLEFSRAGGITSCHPTLTHGAYDLGHKPVATLVHVPASEASGVALPIRKFGGTGGGVAVVEVHVAPSQDLNDDAKSCGQPNVGFSKEGSGGPFVMNSWRLPSTSTDHATNSIFGDWVAHFIRLFMRLVSPI